VAQKSLAVVVENTTGALQRILTTITAQCCAVKSLSAVPACTPGHLKVTLALEGEAHALTRVAKKISRLVNVLETTELLPKISDQEGEAERLPVETSDRELGTLPSLRLDGATGDSLSGLSNNSRDRRRRQ
jgi:hypothetical protein